MRRKLIIGFITLLCVVYVAALSIRLDTKGYQSSSLYLIEAYDNQTQNVYTADSIIFQSERCVDFVNMLGLRQKVCAENITVTTFPAK